MVKYLGMIELLVLSAAFKAVVCNYIAELGSIPRRSRFLNLYNNVFDIVEQNLDFFGNYKIDYEDLD